MNKDTMSRSWFCVLNNPAENISECVGKTPKEICEILSKMWCVSDTRTGAWIFCVSAEGMEHVHMVLESSPNKTRFSAVKKAYSKAHIEPTKGNKKQVEDYIYKRGVFEEKGEKVLETLIIGDIKGKQGKRKDLEKIKEMVESGMTPKQILDSDVNLFRLDTYINKIYYSEKLKNTPMIRNVSTYWHFGDTGTGKSYQAFINMQEKGRDSVYFCYATNKNPFDDYVAQGEIWIDELRSDSGYFNFTNVLAICNPYTAPIQARYNNKLALWNEIHITSPMMPYEVYEYMEKNGGKDRTAQLYRRIDFYVYHYIDNQGKYKTYLYDNRGNKCSISREVIIACAIKAENEEKKQKESSGAFADIPEDNGLDGFTEICSLDGFPM